MAFLEADNDPPPVNVEELGPLGFLDHLLKKERDSNLHLGDVRFWKHLEHMNTNHIYRQSSLEYRSMKLMFFEAIFYAVFLVFLTGYIAQVRAGSIYESQRQQLDYWAGCQRTGARRACSTDKIQDAKGLTSWLQDEFAPRAFTFKDSYPSLVESASVFRLSAAGLEFWTPRYAGDTETNVLLGNVRFRQVRVQFNKTCSIPANLQKVQQECIPYFDTSIQSKMPWNPEYAPDHLKQYFVWSTEARTEQVSMDGYQGTYPPSGFYFDMPLSLQGTKTILGELQEWKWLDPRTRAFIIELNTLNANVNIFVNTRMLFEFPATGGVLVKQEAFAFRATQLSLRLMYTDDFSGTFFFSVMSAALHLMLLTYVVWLMKKNGLRYFTYFWSIIDLVILFIFFVYAIIMLVIFSRASTEPNLQPEVMADPEIFYPLGMLVSTLQLSDSVLAWLGLMGWLKILKYFTLVGAFQPFVRVLERCIVNLLRFAGLVLIVLFGFAVALFVGYGDETNLFSTLWGSFIAVMVAPAGGVDLSPILDHGDFLGPALIFTYVIVIVLLLLNTFMAICVDTYTVSTFEISECISNKPGKGHPTMVFLFTYLSAISGTKLVGKETEEEIGKPEEQQIQLTSLPESVQQRFLMHRERMQRIKANANEEKKELERQKMLADGLLDEEPGEKPAALEDAPNGKPQDNSGPTPPPKVVKNPPPPPVEDLSTLYVKRVQLQRMLIEDPGLQEMCGTDRALDVIRRFRVDNSGVDPYSQVAALQKSVAKKLRELQEAAERGGINLTFDELETLKQVSTELHSALTESQKDWRAELLTVMQMASLLSGGLINLTHQLKDLQANFLNMKLKIDSGGK